MAELKDKIRVRHSVSDETLFYMAMFTGVGLRVGREFYMRQDGRLYRRTIQNGWPCWRDENLGLQDSPENLRRYYRDARDATDSERLIMLA